MSTEATDPMKTFMEMLSEVASKVNELAARMSAAEDLNAAAHRAVPATPEKMGVDLDHSPLRSQMSLKDYAISTLTGDEKQRDVAYRRWAWKLKKTILKQRIED